MADSAPARYVPISEAAAILGVKPFEVVRLIESMQVDVVVDRQSLLRYREENNR